MKSETKCAQQKTNSDKNILSQLILYIIQHKKHIKAKKIKYYEQCYTEIKIKIIF